MLTVGKFGHPELRDPLRQGAAFRMGKVEIQSELTRLIAQRSGISRAEIARLTGMARSSVSEYVQPLVSAGLLAEQSGAYGGRGRPSVGLVLNAMAGVVLAIDLGITHARLQVADLARSRLAADEFRPDLAMTPEKFLDGLARRIKKLMRQAALDGLPLRQVVMGLPSRVDFERGVPVRPPIMPGWDGVPVADALGERLGVPVLVDNDVNLMALGEARARPVDDSPLLFIKVATGIGCGMVTKGGMLHRGADGAAGDIGHIRVSPNDKTLCSCGNVGCIEAVASGSAILRRLRELRGGAPIDSATLSRLVAAGDPQAVHVVRSAAAEIGEVIATLVHTLNPAAIVLGGRMAHVSDDLLSGIRAVVYRRALPLATRRLTIETSRLGRDAGLAGGTALAVDHALSPDGMRMLV